MQQLMRQQQEGAQERRQQEQEQERERDRERQREERERQQEQPQQNQQILAQMFQLMSSNRPIPPPVQEGYGPPESPEAQGDPLF